MALHGDAMLLASTAGLIKNAAAMRHVSPSASASLVLGQSQTARTN